MTTVLDDTDEDDFSDVEPEPEVKSSRAKAPAARRRSVSTRIPKRVQNIRDALAKQMFMTGTMIGMGMPVTGYYICQESDSFTDAVVRLAAKDNRYLDALENLAAIAPAIMIGRTVLGIGCAIGVDRWTRTDGEKGVDPGGRAAMLLGVASAWWEATNGDGHGDSAGPVEAAGPPHSSFIPVA